MRDGFGLSTGVRRTEQRKIELRVWESNAGRILGELVQEDSRR